MSITDSLNGGAERLDSDLLRTFLAIAETGSVTAGAERICRSQSAASLQLKRLETLLGGSVFVRHGRGIALTPLGERLVPVARRVVGLLDEAYGKLRAAPLSGVIRVGIPEEHDRDTLSRVIAAFARAHPQVEVALTCASTVTFPAALAAGRLDLAIHAVDDPSPHHTVLDRHAMVWAVAPDGPAPEVDPVPLALFDRACWWRERALDALESAGRSVRIVCSSESVSGVMAAMEAGLAVGVLPASHVGRGRGLLSLSAAEGFPALSDSLLVLECPGETASPVCAAMAEAIRNAYPGPKRGTSAQGAAPRSQAR
ncbi:LysR family transcriptional regulator [Roseospira navarrensis]|uniref:LysR family transcriptional regulator n=1 Tax=Roseospira navarrensis TaxID=140058 RepID=A0A7X1ZIM0_9PROT|nr:LysR substrate-binding domain-containing protein [Roseospira navarrensis]MQX38132.1 LysR family transcriptional regulator [Roseospira navarrensis]